MLAQSQGFRQDVVNSFNLFVDSAKDVGGAAGKGDSFSLQLGADSIEAQNGQLLLTLTDFSMYYLVHQLLCREYQQLPVPRHNQRCFKGALADTKELQGR